MKPSCNLSCTVLPPDERGFIRQPAVNVFVCAGESTGWMKDRLPLSVGKNHEGQTGDTMETMPMHLSSGPLVITCAWPGPLLAITLRVEQHLTGWAQIVDLRLEDKTQIHSSRPGRICVTVSATCLWNTAGLNKEEIERRFRVCWSDVSWQKGKGFRVACWQTLAICCFGIYQSICESRAWVFAQELSVELCLHHLVGPNSHAFVGPLLAEHVTPHKQICFRSHVIASPHQVTNACLLSGAPHTEYLYHASDIEWCCSDVPLPRFRWLLTSWRISVHP